MKMEDVILTESAQAVRIIHPEDLIFSEEGIGGAERAIKGLAQMVNGREPTSIKWDGYPALVFGRGVDGQLIVCDKYMFGKGDGTGRVTSPAAFRQYDANRGADRTDLYAKINLLWPALEIVIPTGFRGFYVGDLLYAGRLQPTSGLYVFKPNTVTYRVAANSATGQLISHSIAGIAVHTFIPGIGESDQPLDGLGGLPQGGPIWFVSGAMPVPRVHMDARALMHAQSVLKKYGDAIVSTKAKLGEMRAKNVVSLVGPYITSRIDSGNFNHMLEGFYQFLATRLSPRATATMLGTRDGFLYQEGRAGIEGILAVWVAIYNLKLNVKQQIDGQLGSSEVQAAIGNIPGHEGYVVGGGSEKFKLIDRLEFTRANNAKNN
jgi:hypothetical protein